MSQDNPEVVLAVDEEPIDDSSSDMGSSIASSSTSLRSSILDYRLENGRTYHRYKDGKYNLPNDERENDRLDLQHQIWLLALDNSLGVAPPCKENAKVGRVLDVGTGTGIWALDFGDEHPEADVLGNDLSPTQPDLVSPNVKFEIDDVEEDWTYSRPFDYIHSRLMTGSISDWRLYLRRCYENLKPGGFLELQEYDLIPVSDDETLKPDSALLKWSKLLFEASEKFGRSCPHIPTLKDILVDVGFEDVTVSVFKLPSNDWPKDAKYKELGIWQNENMLSGLEGFSLAPLTRAHDWTRAEVDVFLIDVRKDIKNRAIHAYWPAYCVVGRKPEKKET
ncbi:methyltransferase domain-containing protein [Colletotrichum truncatum]|uniref:Methyltransferase domain-containing protein n=1 Tax=Colletotrichum truncatum TaxID=5467 RepID=A0ACC3ZBY8_COLTU